MKNWLIHPSGMIVLVIAAALLAGWSNLQLSQAKRQSESARHQLDQSLRYAKQIIDSADSPSRISEQEMELTLLARLVEKAADKAGIDRRSLDRIWPQPARRIGNTPYQRKTTQLVVREVKLSQAFGFLHMLATGESLLNVDAVRFSTPPGSLPSRPLHTPGQRASNWSDDYASIELWTLEASISHLVYQPLTTDNSIARRDP